MQLAEFTVVAGTWNVAEKKPDLGDLQVWSGAGHAALLPLLYATPCSAAESSPGWHRLHCSHAGVAGAADAAGGHGGGRAARDADGGRIGRAVHREGDAQVSAAHRGGGTKRVKKVLSTRLPSHP